MMKALCRLTFLSFLYSQAPVLFAYAETSPSWREFPREVEVLRPTYVGNFQKTVIKKDIFIFQSKVVIDDLLRSNGGDVLILADEVIVNAPIDTRAYFSMGPDYWVPNPNPDLAEWDTSNSSLAWILRNSKKGQRAFDAHYLWRQYYDPVQKKYVYGVGERPTKVFDAPGKPLKSIYLEIPQLASGQVPLARNASGDMRANDAVGSDGPDAPDADVIWENVRSGSIRIFASSIKLCDLCKKAVSEGPSKSPNGDAFEEIRAVFFQASGLRGGRGGSGSLPACPFDPPTGGGGKFGYTCGTLPDKIGGLSGRPGKGGDAGSVEFNFVNSFQDDAEAFKLIEASDIRGGRPTQVFRERTHSYNYIVSHQNDTGAVSREGFALQEPEIDLNSLLGKNGTVRLSSVTTVSAFNQIVALLLKAEMAGNYAIDLMLSSTRTDLSLFSISPTDTLISYLSTELNKLQQDLVDQVGLSVLQGSSRPSTYPKVFKNFSCKSSDYVGMPLQALEFFHRLCAFRQVAIFGGDNSLRNYLFRTGGLFQTGLADVDIDARHTAIMTELNRLQQMSGNLIDDIEKEQGRIYGVMTGKQKAAMQAGITDLQSKLASLNTVASSANMLDELKIISDIGSHFIKGYAYIVGENWVGAGLEIWAGWQEFGSVITNANEWPVASSDRAGLMEAIEQARKALDAFGQSVIEEKRRLVELQNINLKAILQSRDRLVHYRIETQFRFEEILRATIIDYLQTTADRAGRLNANLLLISTFLRTQDPDISTLNLKPLRDSCSGGIIAIPLSQSQDRLGCVLVKGSIGSSAIISKLDGFKDYPLVVMSSGSGAIPISFGLLFDGNSVEQINVPVTDWQ